MIYPIILGCIIWAFLGIPLYEETKKKVKGEFKLIILSVLCGPIAWCIYIFGYLSILWNAFFSSEGYAFSTKEKRSNFKILLVKLK